jgi:hypothetical protein
MNWFWSHEPENGKLGFVPGVYKAGNLVTIAARGA